MGCVIVNGRLYFNLSNGVQQGGRHQARAVSTRDVDGVSVSGTGYVYFQTSDTSGTGADPYLAMTTQLLGFAVSF
jgi:hypothetical protein